MPESDNVERTRRSYDAFNRRDWRAFAELTAPDIEVESRLVAMEGAYRGEKGLRDWRDTGTEIAQWLFCTKNTCGVW